MTRSATMGVLAAAVLVAGVRLLDWSLRPRASIERAGRRDATTAGPEARTDVVTGDRPERAPAHDVASPLALSGGGGELSILDSWFEPGDAGIRRGGGGWRSALEELDDVLARYSAWSLDVLLDLDLGLPDDVQTARPASVPERLPEAVLARADVTTPVERQTPPLVAEVVEVGGQARSAGGGTASPTDVVTAPRAAESPHAPAGDRGHVTGDAAGPDRPRDPQVDVPPARGFEPPPRPPVDARPDPGAMADPHPGGDGRPELATRQGSEHQFAARPGFSPGPPDECGPDCAPRRGPDCAAVTPQDVSVCEMRALLRDRHRLLDEAPAAAFADAASRSHVQVRLARDLRSIDRALTRIDHAKSRGVAAPSRVAARRIAVYEKRVRSRAVERELIDPWLTRALHFPAGTRLP